jgi:hypothetical protein
MGTADLEEFKKVFWLSATDAVQSVRCDVSEMKRQIRGGGWIRN